MNKLNYQLRDYQKEAVEKGVWGLTKYNKPFIIMAATGAGKSLIIADICHKIDKPILILQPNKEILEQNYDKLLSYDPTIEAGIYSASKGRKEITKFTFATIGSIYKKPEKFKDFKYVIIDECHGLDPKNVDGMLTSFLKAIGVTAVCGLTATPYRIVQKYYEDEKGLVWYTGHLKMINRIYPFFFKKIVYKIETAELIKQGYLSPIDYFVDKTDLSSLKMNKSGTDFTEESLKRFWNNDRLRRIAQAVEYSDKHNKKTLIFCSSITQAKNAMSLCKALGLPVDMVDGKTPAKDRERAVMSFKHGQTKHLFNVGVFTTGFDVPDLNCIILARPTMSLALYYQMIGRGVRLNPTKPDKRLTVYDLAGVVNKFGKVEDIRVKTEKGGFKDEVWSIKGRLDEEPLFKWFVKNKPKFGGKE
ncbi:DEAD/DEAH box helicase [Candidatus Dependentiae bacterium]|nr:MAG: DEAD/DEAH box helicase [Candidatus Dependentiae bacterium]